MNSNDDEKELELIPRSVRDKLDAVEIKLHLHQWQALSLAERRTLRSRACDTPAEKQFYAAELERAVFAATGKLPQRMTKNPKPS